MMNTTILQKMNRPSGWHEIEKDIHYKKDIKYCTLRIARTDVNNTNWIVEITVGLIMVGKMRHIFEAPTPETAMEIERFSELNTFYTNLITELKEETPCEK